MPATVPIFQARMHFGELVDRVQRGEEIIITKHDRPVARLIPEGRESLNELALKLSDFRDFRKSCRLNPADSPPLTLENLDPHERA